MLLLNATLATLGTFAPPTLVFYALQDITVQQPRPKSYVILDIYVLLDPQLRYPVQLEATVLILPLRSHAPLVICVQQAVLYRPHARLGVTVPQHRLNTPARFQTTAQQDIPQVPHVLLGAIALIQAP